MKNSKSYISSSLLLIAVLLSACTGQVAIEPTTIPTPTSTKTPFPSPTSTITVTITQTTTPTLLPTETPDPRPASLTGTISISGETTKPFITSVEIRQEGSFDLTGKDDTDANAGYEIENIVPGTYELWVLITNRIDMVPGCTDVAPPNDTWRMGIKFRDDKALTMGNAYLSKALSLAQNLQASDLQAQAFFAVLENFTIEGGIENKMDVTLLCK